MILAKEELSLSTCIQKAKQKNLILAIAEQKSQNRITEMEKLNYQIDSNKLPTIELNSEFQKQSQFNTLTNSLNISYNLSSLIKQNKLSPKFIAEASEIQKKLIISSLVYQVKVKYYELMQLKEELKILKKDTLVCPRYLL